MALFQFSCPFYSMFICVMNVTAKAAFLMGADNRTEICSLSAQNES